MKFVVGIDEVGRGPLAGDVIAAAVAIDKNNINQIAIDGIYDSKLLSEKKRSIIFQQIIKNKYRFALGRATAIEIDKINILQASLLAMQRAVDNLFINNKNICEILIDGKFIPKGLSQYNSRAIIGGDKTEPIISLAAIIAKISRDQEMIDWHYQYPDYNFAKHKGYGTKEHLLALEECGPCDLHRRSFTPVKKYCKI